MWLQKNAVEIVFFVFCDSLVLRGNEEEKDGAQIARQLTVDTLLNAEVIELRHTRRGKYFRIIADVYVDGVSLKDLHLQASTTRPYSGGNQEGWWN